MYVMVSIWHQTVLCHCRAECWGIHSCTRRLSDNGMTHAILCLQVLTVGTASGHISTYLAALPTVYGAKGVKVAALSSLAEVTVTDVRSRAAVRVELASEPAFCGVGPEHLAVGMNNQVRRFCKVCIKLVNGTQPEILVRSSVCWC